MSSRTALLTGDARGLSLKVSRQLSNLGLRVIGGVRNVERG